MRPTPDVADLVRFAVEAEQAGIDGVMVSEHIVLGPSASEAGLPVNPRDYALPGNQDPATSWPSPLVLLSAVAAATSRLRLVAGPLISPLRHPLASAKDLATLDRLLRRLVAGLAQQAAQVDHHLLVDVLALGMGEERALRPDPDGHLAIVVDVDRADRVQQRGHRVPLDVVADRVLEDLAQRVAVAVVEVL